MCKPYDHDTVIHGMLALVLDQLLIPCSTCFWNVFLTLNTVKPNVGVFIHMAHFLM